MYDSIAIIFAIVVTYRNLILKPRAYIDGYDDPANYDQNQYLQGDLIDIVLRGNVLGVYEPVSLLFRRFVSNFISLSASNVLIISLCLHIVNALLIRGYAENVVRIYRPDASKRNVRLCSGFAVLLFAVHPLRTEVVAWASCQPYLLATLFSILFIQTYPSNFSVVLFLLAVLCKAVSISVPIVLVLLDVHKDMNRKRSNLFRSLILSLKRHLRLFFMCILLACAVMRKTLKDDDDDKIFSLYDFAAKLTFAPSFYLVKSFTPINLSLRYPVPDSLYGFLDFTGCTCIGIFLAVSIMTIVTLLVVGTATKTRERFSLIWLVFLGLLSPTSLTNHCAMIAADRYSYLPAAFLGVPLSACIFVVILPLLTHRRMMIVLLFPVLLCSIFSRITSNLVDSWEIEENLWQRLLNINPDGDTALYLNLGTHYMELGRIEDASSLYEKAIRDHNIESPELVSHYAASLTLRGLNEDAASVLSKYENELSISGLSLLTSSLYTSQKFNESYKVFERHYDSLVSSLRDSMDATIMTCDILRRNHRLVEAELLCRRALSRGHTETVLRAMSNLLLDQIEKNDRVVSWNRVVMDDFFSSKNDDKIFTEKYVMKHYDSDGSIDFFLPKQSRREVEAYMHMSSEMGIARSKNDVLRMTQLCRSMLNLNVERDVILSHLEDASKIGCRIATSVFQDSSAVSRTGPEVIFSLQEPYSYAECLSSLGSTYADLKLLEEAAEYFDKAASSFEIEQQDFFRSGAEFYNAATMYGELTRWNEARVRFQRSIERRPDLSIAYCYLGSISYMLRERDRGLKEFKNCFDDKNGMIGDQFYVMRDALKEGTFQLDVKVGE